MTDLDVFVAVMPCSSDGDVRKTAPVVVALLKVTNAIDGWLFVHCETGMKTPSAHDKTRFTLLASNYAGPG